MKHASLALILSCALALPIGGAYATDAANSAPAAMDANAMKAMMERTSPNEHHTLLGTLVGEWEYTTSMKMNPNDKPVASSGTSSIKSIFGGRFIQSTMKGAMIMNGQSQAFEGMGLSGYDNSTEEFNEIWLDDMSTSIMHSKGTYDAKTKTITYKGTYSCPMNGAKNAPFRSDLKFIDADSYSYTMYALDDAGKEYAAFEMLSKRKK
jgi:Protein of unknown function (DUF1579)